MGLKLKLTLLVCCLVTSALGGSGAFIVLQTKKALEEEHHRRSMAVALDMARVSATPLIGHNFAQLRHFVRYAMKQEYVVAAMILDKNGRIVMHNDLAKIGSIYSVPHNLQPHLITEPSLGDHHHDMADGPNQYDINIPIKVAGVRLGTAVIEYSERGVEEAIAALTQQIVLILVGGLLISALVALLLAEYITRPLKKLRDAADRLSQGNFTAGAVPVTSNDEIGYLTRAFNTMAHQLKHMVCHDPLTGIYNRQMFQARLAEECAHSQRHHLPLVLLMIDIDHFKEINDTHGHLIGDEILSAFANLIRDNLRREDCLARFGGEEFIIIAPDTNEQTALKFAERLRRVVEENAFMTNSGQLIRITASVGVALFGGRLSTADALISAADQALYAAKNSGRNRVCRYHPDAIPERRA